MKHITLNKTTYKILTNYVYIRQKSYFLDYQNYFLVCKVFLIDFEFSQLDFIRFSRKQH